MKKLLRTLLCFTAPAVFFSFQLPAQLLTQSLSGSWQFSEVGKNEWLPATVPGTVHTDLMANGKIPDPYDGMNEEKVQWVETKTWEYRRTFDCDKKLWKQKNKELVFEGLDTYADVYLNDSLVITSIDMFVTYRRDVASLLKKKGNILRIVFHPVSELVEKTRALSDYKNLPGGDRVYVRKAQYQFGWDFGPRIVTSGIWKPVRLEGWTGFAVEDIFFWTDALQNDTAWLTTNVILKQPGEKKQPPIQVTIRDEKNVYFSGVLKSRTTYGNDWVIPVAIPHPRLWWCNGMGKQEFYEFTCEIKCGKKRVARTIRYGIRKIVLVREAEKPDYESFYFELNDRRVFMKGANWVPCDLFLPRVTTEKYRSFLESAQQSNMNMLRVWGGGVYEDDRFYDLCDSLGLLVWQDFMFACGMYPETSAFFEASMTEGEQQFLRINRHPCLALWCGNNENREGWDNWGWQEQVEPDRREKLLITSYDFFANGLGGIVRADRNANFISSSPVKYGWGHREAYSCGDSHYWGVWWGKEPFSAYETHVGRFMTEYGFQSLPDERTIYEFAGSCMTIDDPSLRLHQKHPTGFETISEYQARDYPEPRDFRDDIYLSQVMQLDGISRAIEAHRRSMPYCMGSLFWQYDDCWPAVSWSSVDYYGRPKLLQYALKDLYAPVIVSIAERNDSVLIYLVNDDTVTHQGMLGLRWLSFDGTSIRTSLSPASAYAASGTMTLAFSKKMLLDTLPAEKGVLQVVFNYENGKSVQSHHFFAPARSLALAEDPGVTYDVSPQKDAQGNFVVTLRSVSLARNVFLSIGKTASTFSDNGFDLLPGEERTVLIQTTLSYEELKTNLGIRTMNSLVRQ